MLGSRKILDTRQTGPMYLFIPHPAFLKNQLAKECPDSVAIVVNPALAPTLDKYLKADRLFCPVIALCYYLDSTPDLR